MSRNLLTLVSALPMTAIFAAPGIAAKCDVKACISV